MGRRRLDPALWVRAGASITGTACVLTLMIGAPSAFARMGEPAPFGLGGMVGASASLITAEEASTPVSAVEGESPYSYYVGCGLSLHTQPSHHCLVGSKTGAFFESADAAVVYEVCVRFPTGGSSAQAIRQPNKGRCT